MLRCFFNSSFFSVSYSVEDDEVEISGLLLKSMIYHQFQYFVANAQNWFFIILHFLLGNNILYA